MKPRANAAPGGMRRVRPTPITLSPDRAVSCDPPRDGATLPLVYRPARDDVDLVTWARPGRDALIAALRRHGALLFRGFGITEPEAFAEFAAVFADELFTENGEHPQAVLSGKVYAPTFFPPEEKLLWHNENTFNAEPPSLIWFCCRQPAEKGGETPIVDSRAVYQRIAPELREEFTLKQVMYIRNYRKGLGLDWREVFRTEDRRRVESECARQGLEYEWFGDRLRTSCVRPAVVRHPETGEWSWFNQAQHWHTACLNPATRASLLTAFPPEELPRSCFFGDGSVIPDDAMTQICAVYQDLEETFAWQRGDVLMLDNIATAHARNPFQGHRSLLVAMASHEVGGRA
jgi:alpha-ketoglutarate-dependent taurine dioxygenase